MAREGAFSPSEPSGVQRWEEEVGSPSLGSAVIACIVILSLFQLEKQTLLHTQHWARMTRTLSSRVPCLGEGGLAGHQSSRLTQRRDRVTVAGVVEQGWERLMKVVALELNLVCLEDKKDFSWQQCVEYVCMLVCVSCMC